MQVVPLIDVDGRNVAVMIAKATFRFDVPTGMLAVATQQMPVAYADEFTPDGQNSRIRIPSDLVVFKPATDILVVEPERGVDRAGLYGRRIFVDVGPVHILGRVGRSWEWGPLPRDRNPRKRFAGTYDKAWTENRMPLLPLDFDVRYNQAAPTNQQVPEFLKGDELIKVRNLYEDGRAVEFFLPGRTIVVSGNVLNRYFTEVAKLDTLLVWTDEPKVSLIWRHIIRPRQKIEEVSNVNVNWVRLRTARELYGKP